MRSSTEPAALRGALFAACVLLGGCGGGGGGGSSPENRVPVLRSTQFSSSEDVDLTAQLDASDPDGDALTFVKTSEPSNGVLTAFSANGAFTYRPRADMSGSDSFRVVVSDTKGGSIAATVAIQIAPVNDPIVVRNDTLRADDTALASVNVLANDDDPDRDATVAIEEPAAVGTATVNTDGSVRIAGLPAGFRGVTRFKYRLTEPGGAFTVGAAAVFVDMDPFRVAFVADQTGDGALEVYLADLAAPPVRVTAATEGSLRMRGFAASENGATVVYCRNDTATSTVADLSFVRTANPAVATRVPLPVGFPPAPDTNGFDQYAVSPDGLWIAAIGGSASSADPAAVFLVNVNDLTVVHSPMPQGVLRARWPRFSADSQQLYFVATDEVGANPAIYRTAVRSPSVSVRLSATPSGSLSDAIQAYAVSADQSRVIFHATRNDTAGIYYVNPANPGAEIRITHALNVGDLIWSSTVGNTIDGSRDGTRIAYTAMPAFGQTMTYVADVSPTPNPRVIAGPASTVTGMRPDNAALLYSATVGDVDQIYEAMIDSPAPHVLVGEGHGGTYDSTGNTVLLRQARYTDPGMSDLYLTVGAATRESFGTTQHVGTPGMAARFTIFTAVDRAIVLLGEGPTTTPPFLALARMALINQRAPDKLIYLTDLYSPISFRSGRARPVSP